MATKEDTRHWVGFDLGGTKMLGKVFDSKFRSLSQDRAKTKGNEGVESGLVRITKTIHKMLDRADLKPKDIAGIGFGCPGPLDLERGIAHSAPNLSWENVPLKDHLEDEFGCPAVILNDVDAGVYGEYRFGVAAKSRVVVGVFPGTGIGGGCVYEGSIMRGATGSCMEIGHVQVAPEGPLCGCGQRGCLEAVASRLVIASRAAAAAYRGQAPHLLENSGTDLTKIRSKALADSIAAGDTAVENIVRDAARQIGRAVAGVVHLLGPDLVVLGGGLVEAMPKLFVTEVNESAKKRVLPALMKTFEVVPAKLGDDAGVMGAAAWAQHNVDTDANEEA
ncbi:ROK family protein [Symmachiella dynata]|uniref:ROK family protein n=1 Tax=Symmachiella dynata TaxID=2527995 RepID=UPI0030ECCFE7